MSNLYWFAQEAEIVPPGFNPVGGFTDKPQRPQHEAKWLEVHDGALLLEAARTLPPVTTAAGVAIGAEVAEVLLATLLLTGGRRGEELALELEDVSLDRKTITFREPLAGPAQDAGLLARRAALAPGRGDPPGVPVRAPAPAARLAPVFPRSSVAPSSR